MYGLVVVTVVQRYDSGYGLVVMSRLLILSSPVGTMVMDQRPSGMALVCALLVVRTSRLGEIQA